MRKVIERKNGRMILNAAAEQKTAEVLLYGDVGAGYWDGISAQDFVKGLSELPAEISLINCRINSYGGEVADGMAIYNALLRHKARVVTHVDGAAVSIASVIAQAGDEVRISANAVMMIHDPWTCVCGSASDCRREAQLLDKIATTIVGVYVARSGKPADVFEAAMHAETWYTAAEAVAAGLAGVLVPNKTGEDDDAEKGGGAGAVDFADGRFAKAPQWVRDRARAQKIVTTPPDIVLPPEASPWRLALARRRLELLRKAD